MNQFAPAGGRRFQYAARGAVLLTLVHLCGLQLRSDSELHQIWASALRTAAGRAAWLPLEKLDRMAHRTGSGNALLKLSGSTKKTADVEDQLSFVYYRMGYSLYPRRIFVAPADQVINNGWDIMRIEFRPDPQWLREHAVRSVVTYGKDDAGGETLRLQKLAPGDERPATPTDESEDD